MSERDFVRIKVFDVRGIAGYRDLRRIVARLAFGTLAKLVFGDCFELLARGRADGDCLRFGKDAGVRQADSLGCAVRNRTPLRRALLPPLDELASGVADFLLVNEGLIYVNGKKIFLLPLGGEKRQKLHTTDFCVKLGGVQSLLEKDVAADF